MQQDQYAKGAPPPALPEIDDELAALEANSPARTGVMNRILNSIAAKAKSPNHGPVKVTPDHSRRTRRAMARSAPDYKPVNTHGRLGRAKPVKSQAQLAYEYKTAVRGALSRIKVVRLITECPELKFVAGTPGLKTVWQLSQAPTEWIHSIPGLGEKRRKRIHAYLIGKDVPVAWKP